MSLKGKRILLGVTGSIAAYKSAFLVRLLVKAGAEVQVVMTASAFDFITPLTLATLSKHPVLSQFQKDETGQWNNHVELGLWADLMVIAPASANTISKIAHGLCDNLLSAVYLSARCAVMIAPAMDLDMYRHPSVLESMGKLRSYGNLILEAESGELASGLSGQGRMMEPERMVEAIHAFFSKAKDFQGKKVLITLGPTQEAIDPVRFISNHSSGKMGKAIAEAFAARGAEVFVVAGPTSQHFSEKIRVTHVRSAADMYEACQKIHSGMDLCIFAAAVADYAPANPAKQKIKKSSAELTITLAKNIDIADALGKAKSPNQIHVGFALETENEIAHASEKLSKKNFDLIVLNSLQDRGAGFQGDTNKVTLIHASGQRKTSELLPKSQIAELILDEIKNVPVWV
ncbi:bifunctional phosphopantothenoylcysteine decarboxylase/phosphopantothenate--cysteine ligase CoaBC [Algoriphagus namhaensis]